MEWICIEDCNEGLELETELNPYHSMIIDQKEAEKIKSLTLLDTPYITIKETIEKFNKIERLDVYREFYEACKYSDKIAIYLHKNKNNELLIKEMKGLMEQYGKQEGFNPLPLDRITVVEANGKEKEFKTCKEGLKYLLFESQEL